jgi:hypothetical protein
MRIEGTAMPVPEHTALYRFYDAEGFLLYIGITSNLTRRNKEHAGDYWSHEVSSTTVAWFADEASAAEAETAAIRAEAPRYNVRDNFDHVPFPCPGWPSLAGAGRQKAVELAKLIRAEISSGRWPVGHKIPAPKEMAGLVGIGTGAANHAIQTLRSERVIYRFKSYGYFVSEQQRQGPLSSHSSWRT